MPDHLNKICLIALFSYDLTQTQTKGQTRPWYKKGCSNLAAELILHGKVNKPDTSSDQGIDEPDRV